MSVHVIKAPAGLGKTSLILDKIPTTTDRRIEFYVPTLELAKEIATKLKDGGVTSKVVMGRAQLDEGRLTLCRKPALAAEVSRLGYPVFPVICMGQSVPGDHHTHGVCEFFSSCAYLKQFEANERVLIYTHAYLPLPRNNKESIHPSLVVIDESFLSACLETYEFPRGALVTALKAESMPNAKSVVSLLLRAFDDSQPVLAALRSNGVSDQQMKVAQKETCPTGAGFNPFTSDVEFLNRLRKDGVSRLRVDILIEVLSAELKTLRSESQGITFDPEKQVLRVHFRKPITRFRNQSGEPKIIIIDANANVELIKPWFPNATFQEIAVSRKAHVIQCSSLRGSMSSFIPQKHTSEDSRKWAQGNLDGLQDLLDRECHDANLKWLVVGPQAVTGNPNSKIKPLLSCLPNMSFAHFNGLRGVDGYKDFDGAIIVGRNQPSIEGLEFLARALWFDSPDPLTFTDEWVLELRPYRMRDPAGATSVEVLVHPDHRIQLLHEQLREGESTQAIDRLRLIHAAKAKRVIVVSSIPLEIEVDELKTFAELAHQTRLERALAELGGVLPLNPEFLATRFPHLWATPAAAKNDIARGNQKDQIINNISINNLSLLNYEYRTPGQRRRSRALSCHAFSRTHSELTRLLWLPVTLREVVDGVAGAEVFGGLGTPRFEPMRMFGSDGSAPQ